MLLLLISIILHPTIVVVLQSQYYQHKLQARSCCQVPTAPSCQAGPHPDNQLSLNQWPQASHMAALITCPPADSVQQTACRAEKEAVMTCFPA